MSVDPLWFEIISDLFVNLAAAWFAAALFISHPAPLTWSFLTANLALGTVSLVIAFITRQLVLL